MEEHEDLIPINIGNVNQGAVVEAFNLELAKVLANIADLSTPAAAKRSIKMEMILTPQSDRVTIQTELKVTSKLAGIETHRSKIFLGKSQTGGLVAFDADPRQMPLWSAPAPRAVAEPIAFSPTKT